MTNRQLSQGPHFITTAPSITHCPVCRTAMLAATVGGIDRHIDPTTLNDDGELMALLAGRATYELHGELLVRRDVTHIAAADRAWPVLAEHDCRVRHVPENHIDHTHGEKAAALVRSLLGGQLVIDPYAEPPF